MNPEIRRIIKIVCEYFDIAEEALSSKSRKREHTDARHIVVKIARERCAVTLREVGEAINRNHDVIFYYENKPIPRDLQKHFDRIINIFDNGNTCPNCGCDLNLTK